MKIDDYMEKAMTTALPSALNMQYMGFNLVAEVGEVLGIEAKVLRDHEGNFQSVPDMEALQKKELGDAFWQLVGICFVKGYLPSELLQANLDKLADRQKRGVIGGSGDTR